MTFRNALDAEMREANKLGVAQERKMAERKEIAEEEESKLWKLNLLCWERQQLSLYFILSIFIMESYLDCVLMNTGCYEPAISKL